MKILFLTPHYSPHIGGVEKHLGEVVKILSKENQISIITQKSDSSSKEFEKKDGVEIYRIPFSTDSKLRTWLWLFQHIKLFLDADVIHVHDVFYWILPFRFFLFWKSFYITFHGYEAPGPLTESQIRWHKLAAKLTNGNICVGDFHKHIYGIQPTVVTYGGVEKALKNKMNKIENKKSVQILFVGRIANDTGVKTYLSGLKKVAKNLNIQADFYGEGDLKNSFEEEAKEHHLPVQFKGVTLQPEKLYSGADIVFASQYLGILQALNYNRPVIAVADSPLKKTYLRYTPFAQWIKIASSADEVAHLVNEVINEKFHLPAEAVEWVQQQTWENVAKNYLHLWSK